MCAAEDRGDVIILSDDDGDDVVCYGPGVDAVNAGREEKEKNGTTFYFALNSLCCSSTTNCTYCSSSSSSFSAPCIGSAEDVMVTFSRRPELLPHARHDCPLHLFTQVSPLVYFWETLSSKFSFLRPVAFSLLCPAQGH